MGGKISDAIKYVGKNSGEILSLLRHLIRYVDRNSLDYPVKTAAYVVKWLDEHGFKDSYEVHEYLSGLPNIVVKVGPSPEDGVVFLGHMDVVPPGDHRKWRYPPFMATVSGNRVYGRGASDMKGGITAMLYALHALVTVGYEFRRGVTIALTSDGEKGGFYGTNQLVGRGIVRGRAAVIGEPTGSFEAGHAIMVGDKGFLWIRMVIEGRSIHAGIPVAGLNPIEKVLSIAYEIDRRLIKSYMPDARVKRVIKENMGYIEKMAEALNVHKEALVDALLYPTVSISRINGGGKVLNMVPDVCDAALDIRIPWGLSIRDVERLLVDMGIKGNLLGLDPSFMDPGNSLVGLVAEAYRKVYKRRPYIGLNYGSSDAVYLMRAGIPTVLLGPGSFTAHSVDEYVDLRDVVNMAKTYVRIVEMMERA